MKKILSFFAATLFTMSSFAGVVASYSAGTGTFTYAGTAEETTSPQKYDANTITPAKAITFANSFMAKNADEVYVPTNYATVAIEGGFKAGDTVKVVAYFNNSDDTKAARLGFFTPADEPIDTLGLFINGRTVAGMPPVQYFVLQADVASMKFARVNREGESATRVNVLELDVVRPEGAVDPVDPQPQPAVIEGPVVAIVDSIAGNASTGLAGAATRGGFVVDGDKVIVTSAADGKLHQFSAADLSSLGQMADSIQAGAYYMDMDDAGNYVFFEWTVGSGTRDGAYIYNKTAGTTVHVDLPILARADQPACAGNLVAGNGAIFISPNGKEFVHRYNFVDGALTTIDSIPTPGHSGGGINTISPLDKDHFFVHLRGSKHIYVDATDAAAPIVKVVAVKNLEGNFVACHGSEAFQLAGHTFLATGNYSVGKYLGAFNIIDVTDPEDAYSVYAEPDVAATGAMGTSAVEFRAVADGETVHVYEFAGFALRKYDFKVRAAAAGKITIEKKNAPELIRLDADTVKSNLRFNVKANEAMGNIAVQVMVYDTVMPADAYTFADGELVIPYSFTAVDTVNYVITARGFDEGVVERYDTLKHTLIVAPALQPKTIAEAIAEGDKAEVLLGEVYITFNPYNETEMFIADATGALDVYYKSVKADFDVKDHDLYYAGAAFTGLQGKMSLYNGIWEIVPAVKASELVYTEDKTVTPAPYTTFSADFTNQLVVMTEVPIVDKVEGSYTNHYAQFTDSTEVQVFKKYVENDVVAGHKYNLKGIMTIFKGAPELYIIEAEDLGEIPVEDALDNINSNVKATKVVRNGQIYIIRNNNEYTATGVQVK